MTQRPRTRPAYSPGIACGSRRIAAFVLCALIGTLLIAACQPQSAAQDAAITPTSPDPAPAALAPAEVRPSVAAAQGIVADFLNAWGQDNYDTMYALLTSNSRDAYSREQFGRLYADAERLMTVEPDGKQYTLTNIILQGNVAQVAYDMTFETQLFGTFTDEARVLQLVSVPEGWRVAWTPGDIFAEFRQGAALTITRTRPSRGNIYDRDGAVIADMNGQSVIVTLRTQQYPDDNPDACFTELARVFRARTADQIRTLFGPATGRDFAYEIGELSMEVFIRERPALEQHCTLNYANRPTRRYLAGGLAPHVVGYVGPIPAEEVDSWVARGYPQDAMVGIDGIERYWEEALAGRPAVSLQIVLNGVTVRTLARREAMPSQSVYLTLDRRVQEGVQDILRDAFANSTWGTYAPGAAAVVLDVRTGEVRAIASYPDFNVDAFNPNTALPNAQALIDAWAADPRRPTFNRAALGQYPAGSVFKIVTMAAGLDSGQFQLNTRYTCRGTWYGDTFGDRRRQDWLTRGHGTITLQQALTGSCNIYFWHVAWTLNGVDPAILPDYARRMGFGAPTGIRDVAESPGNVPDPARHVQLTGRTWTGSDALNAAIGQGEIVVTPLQIANMVAAVANDGTLYQPLLVRQVGIIGEPSYIAEPVVQSRLNFNPGVLEGIRAAMCAVTTDPTIGTAYFVFRDWPAGVVVCGKTGTAETGRLPHAWFAAYAGRPANEPEIAIAVIVEHSNEGSFVAAPIVRRIVEMYYDLPITPWPSWYGGGMPTFETGGQ